MDRCDVLIVGGGPAGAACAWALKDSGLDVAIIDKSRFPRNKVCGGWITPQVVEELRLDLARYAAEHVLQPIRGFITSRIGCREIRITYPVPISYGIRRCEFDDFLVRRSGARLWDGIPVTTLQRSDGSWIINGQIRTALVIGAGGHYCPVARLLGATLGTEDAVVAQETEFLMDAQQQSECSVSPEIPELFFCADLRGYGWCFRKGNFLNVGIGRLDKHRLSSHVRDFLDFLRERRKVPRALPGLSGHAYLLYRTSRRSRIGEGVVLIGDAAGLAYTQSGEGIRPAIESGLLAAKVVLAARGDFSGETLQNYDRQIRSRFGATGPDWSAGFARLLPEGLRACVTSRLLQSKIFTRRVLLNRWFLHAYDPALLPS